MKTRWTIDVLSITIAGNSESYEFVEPMTDPLWAPLLPLSS